MIGGLRQTDLGHLLQFGVDDGLGCGVRGERDGQVGTNLAGMVASGGLAASAPAAGFVSLTSNATCGRQNKHVAYQSPSSVVGAAPSTGEGGPRRAIEQLLGRAQDHHRSILPIHRGGTLPAVPGSGRGRCGGRSWMNDDHPCAGDARRIRFFEPAGPDRTCCVWRPRPTWGG